MRYIYPFNGRTFFLIFFSAVIKVSPFRGRHLLRGNREDYSNVPTLYPTLREPTLMVTR